MTALGRSRRLLHRIFRSLAQRNYRRYAAGHVCSVIGTWMQRIGQDWLVLELSGSAVALGISLACQFLPVLLFGVWAGVVVDRVDTRRLLLITQAAQAGLAVALAVLALTNTATLPVVYALALALGLVTTLDTPARQTFVAELVDEDNIVNAQSLNSVINNVGRLVGPAIAGIVIAVVGVGTTFVVNAVSFLAVLLGLLGMDAAEMRPSTRVRRGPGQARAGLRYVWQDRELRATTVLVAVVSIFGQNFRVVFPILAIDEFAGDASTYGWFTTALGAGAVAGALASAALTVVTPNRLRWLVVAFALVNAAVAVTPTLPLALAAIVLLGVVNIQINAVARAILQVGTEPSFQGRVMAIHVMVFMGGTPIGSLLFGVLCELAGSRAALALAGAACLLGVAALWRSLRRDSPPTMSSGDEQDARHIA